MLSPSLAISRSEPRTDSVTEATRALARALPAREDSRVLVDFIEDDLRQGLQALAEVQAHFGDLLEALSAPRPSSIEVLYAADDLRVLAQLDTVVESVTGLRRRLSKAAGQLQRR